nr:phenylacetic acid degradation bifunctional protein PaaZ [Hyphomonas sp.]
MSNYYKDDWKSGEADFVDIISAVNGKPVARTSSAGIDFADMVRHGRNVGGPALRAMTFHERAAMLKGLAQALMDRKDDLYAVSRDTGATDRDAWPDIEGGAGTLFSLASKAKRELPNSTIILDGPIEGLSKGGTFVGQHIHTSKLGVAVQINAYNFPIWGMLEKLGPALMAGMPVIIKPATPTAQLAESAVQIMVATGLLPKGAVQLVVGSAGDLLSHLTGQDVVSFTGSAATAAKLKTHPTIIEHSVPFIAEQDSLNASMLGPEVAPDDEEFQLFVKEVSREMTVKAGQKCTAIRRILVPSSLVDAVQDALVQQLSGISIGDPADKATKMGALVSAAQRADVVSRVGELEDEAEIVHGSLDEPTLVGDGAQTGAFMSPVLLRCSSPLSAEKVHSVEAFGPVATLMPYDSVADAIELCRLGGGSLVMSLFTHNKSVAREVVLGTAPFHGRIAIINRDCARESTGHGSPLPVLVHGGPGRAGGGEEMGGVRGIKHYMQRTAIQGSPDILTAITESWVTGAKTDTSTPHPFRYKFGDLEIGKTIETGSRTVSLEDIEHFAEFTGDNFYAHMDEEAAAANPFFPGRVAHGYLILSFAAGLFVDPEPGPVLANYGLDDLRFLAPVTPGETLTVRLTAKSKKKRNDEYGEVNWDVEVTRADGKAVATYTLLTMNAI